MIALDKVAEEAATLAAQAGEPAEPEKEREASATVVRPTADQPAEEDDLGTVITTSTSVSAQILWGLRLKIKEGEGHEL